MFVLSFVSQCLYYTLNTMPSCPIKAKKCFNDLQHFWALSRLSSLSEQHLEVLVSIYYLLLRKDGVWLLSMCAYVRILCVLPAAAVQWAVCTTWIHCHNSESRWAKHNAKAQSWTLVYNGSNKQTIDRFGESEEVKIKTLGGSCCNTRIYHKGLSIPCWKEGYSWSPKYPKMVNSLDGYCRLWF